MYDTISLKGKTPTIDSELKIITIGVPEPILQCIEDLVDLGFTPSRSHCYRDITTQFLIKLKTSVPHINNFRYYMAKMMKERGLL